MARFENFREAIMGRVVAMNRVLDADGVWPGFLFVEDRGGRIEIAVAISLAGMTDVEKQMLARVVLPGAIRDSGADRFCWVMPGDGAEADGVGAVEYLVLVFGERGQAQAVLAPVLRDGSAPPKLGPWRTTVSVSGLFVEPLLEAVERALRVDPMLSLDALL